MKHIPRINKLIVKQSDFFLQNPTQNYKGKSYKEIFHVAKETVPLLRCQKYTYFSISCQKYFFISKITCIKLCHFSDNW